MIVHYDIILPLGNMMQMSDKGKYSAVCYMLLLLAA